MALPTDIAGLYAWYKAGSFSLADGDTCGTWLDSSGNARNMAITLTPKYYSNQVAGYPAVRTGSAYGGFSLAGFNWLANLANHTKFIVFKTVTVGGAGVEAGIFGGCYVSGYNGIGEFLCHRAAGLTATYATTGPTKTMISIACATNEWHYGHSAQTAASLLSVSLDGGSETTSALGARVGDTQNGYIGLDSYAYYDGYVAEAIVYSSALSSGDKALVNAYLRDKYFAAAPGQQEQVRDALSRRLWLLRRPTGIFEATVPLWMLDADILDRVAVESRVGPAPAAAGWGGKKWQRRAFTVQRIDVDPGAGTAKMQLLDRRPLDVLLWDSARTDERNASARQSGVARISKGNGWTFSRLSNAWIENPADPTSVVSCAQTERAVNQAGEYLEEARTNEVLRSSFASGTTGLTLAGTGTNGSAIAVDTADLFFGAETTPNSLKFTAGSPHAAELRATFPATASWATTSCRLTIDHKTDSGEKLYWRLQRSGDSNYWNDSTGAWGAGSVDNACATSATRDPANRTISKAITMDGTSRTLTLAVFLQTGGTASRISHLYHVQIERGSFPTSRIVTDAAAVTRVKTQLSHDVTTAAKIYDPALGAFWCQVTPDWSSADLGSTEDMYLYYMETNGAADYDALFYDASAAAWVFARKVGGSTYTATKSGAVTRGTTYSIGARWTGVEAELGLTAYTISVFVNGVKGTDATSAAPTFTSPETLYRGSTTAFANQANAAVREVRIFPYAPTDEEMARFP